MLVGVSFTYSCSLTQARACIAAAIDLDDIPYAEGVRFAGTSPCLHGTCGGVLDRIQGLLSSVADEGNPRIVLLTGVAGYGKSAVASMIAEQFEERWRLGSSFFFNRNDNGQNCVDNVFSTIARDIADQNPEIKKKLWSTVKGNRSLRKTTNVREQFIQFILEPAKDLPTIGPIIVVIDGLDKCGNATSRKQLINVLAKELSDLPVNFRILLTVRPEEDIIRGLASLQSVQHIKMESIEKKSTKADLSAFIIEELSDIKNELERGWPGWQDALVEKAGDLFIWISTACWFIKNEGKGGTDHVKLLKQILSETPQMQKFAPLDVLYQSVLRSAFEEQDVEAMSHFKAVVGKIVAVKVLLSRAALSDLLQVEELISYNDSQSLVESVVSYLGSVLMGTTERNTPLRMLHLSFQDFLTERLWSAGFFIDANNQTKSMAILCLDVMREDLKHDMCKIGDPIAPNLEIQEVKKQMVKFEALQYVCRYWIDHVVACEELELERIKGFFCYDVLH
jgi:hypothetical protein